MASKRTGRHTLQGELRVAIHQADGEWHATAIDFDVLGTGDTPEDARRELFALMHSYFLGLVAELRKSKTVHFFNPTPEEEYDAAAVECYAVEFTATCKPHSHRPVSSVEGMEEIIGYIDTLEDVRFEKCGAA